MKFKEWMKLLGAVVVKLFGVPILFAVAAYGFGISIIGMFAIGFAINYILGTAYTYHYNLKHEQLIAEQNKAMLSFETKNTVKVKCAFCHAENIVPLDLENTKFLCKKCQKANRLVTEFSTAQITVPQSTNDMIGRGVEP